MGETPRPSPRTSFIHRPAVRIGVSIGLALLFLYLAFRGTDLAAIGRAILAADYRWIAAYIAVLMISHLLRAWRWRYMLDPIKPGIGLRNLFSGVMIGYMLNNILPRAGELGRPYVIGKLERIPAGSALGTVVVERVLDTLSFVLLVAVLPLLYRGPLRESFPWLADAGVMILAVLLPVFGVLVALMLRREWADALLRLFARFLPKRVSRFLDRLLHSFLDGFLFLKDPGHIVPLLVLSVLIWFLYGVMTWCGLNAFALGDSVGFGGAIVVLAIASIGVAIPTPGSTGSYHAFVSQALVRLFGVEQTLALSVATATHAAGFIAVTIVGLYFFSRDNIRMADAVSRRPQPGETA